MNVAGTSRIGAIASATVHVGTSSIRGAVDDLARHATTSFHADVFRVGDDAVVDSLGSLASRDVPISILADTDATTGKLATALRTQVGDAWDELGGDPLKQHGKSASRDGGIKGFVGTDIADEDAVRRIELGVTFEDEAAAALGTMHAATGSRLAAAIDAAAATGVVANDPRTGAKHATEAVGLLIDGHGGRLRIMTKAFDDKALAERIAASVRGAKLDEPAELLTHEIPKAQRRLLKDAGVVVRKLNEQDAEQAKTALHGTVIDTNRGAFLGSLYLKERVLHGSSGRQSREVGVMLVDDAAAQARAAYDHIAAANA